MFTKIIFFFIILYFSISISSVSGYDIIVINSTTGKLIPQSIRIDGGNLSGEPVLVQIIDEPVPHTILDWVLLFSGIATTVLVLIVWKQLQLSKNELVIRLRPWISVSPPTAKSYIFPNGEVSNYDDFQDQIDKKQVNEFPSRVIFGITIKNVGTLPAKDMLYRFMIKDSEITIDELRMKKQYDVASLAPNMEDVISYPKTISDFDGLKIYYVGLDVEYSLGSKVEYSGGIWQMRGNTSTVIKDWI